MKGIIYREDAVARITAEQKEEQDIDCIYIYSRCKTIIKHMPSAERTRWIPVSERLPKEKEIVILCTNTEHASCGYYNGREFYSANTTMHDAWTWNPDVIAWMPLPKPYEEE